MRRITSAGKTVRLKSSVTADYFDRKVVKKGDQQAPSNDLSQLPMARAESRWSTDANDFTAATELKLRSAATNFCCFQRDQRPRKLTSSIKRRFPDKSKVSFGFPVVIRIA
jgi:hypothetical protein